MEILKERFAKSEIDEAEFEEKRRPRAKKRPGACSGPYLQITSVIHPASGRHGGGRLLLWFLGDHRLRGDEQSRDGRRILQRGADHFGRIDYPLANKVA